MRTYNAYFKKKQIEIQAESSWQAVEKAREIFKPNKKDKYLISVVLADKPIDGASLPGS